MDPLISTEAAHQHILAAASSLGTETVSLTSAAGYQLAEDLIADRPLPPFNRAMMDGITFSSSSLSESEQSTLQIAGLHAAGSPSPKKLSNGHCWEIMTGACVPNDCDTLIPYEEVTIEDNKAQFATKKASPKNFIHKTGSDFKKGHTLAESGTFIGSRETSIAASIGKANILVNKKPRIAIVSTGDELVPIESSPLPYQIRQSNGHSLTAALSKLLCKKTNLYHLPDNASLMQERLQHICKEHDIVLLCGGISKGKKDFVRPTLETLLGKPAFHGVAQKPGKPFAFWSNTPLVFALPGNPMSVLVCFHRYVLPALCQMGVNTPQSQAVLLKENFDFKPSLTSFIPAILENHSGTLFATATPTQNSGDFASAIDTHGFLEFPANKSTFEKGELFRFHPWL